MNTTCNYFLLQLKKGTALELKAFLVKEYSILIRDASNFIGLNNSFFRVAIQGNEQNTILVQGIKNY